ncbi:hypothetical protein Scep_030322 [Stephania cephalantha]|uniref:Uncharacterized protein n=1 Tax=Stephania cephalantha TaxID=152367 RepID=A0AAP0HGS1_9MAGN
MSLERIREREIEREGGRSRQEREGRRRWRGAAAPGKIRARRSSGSRQRLAVTKVQTAARCSGEPTRRPARKGARGRAVAARRGGVLTAATVSGYTGEGLASLRCTSRRADGQQQRQTRRWRACGEDDEQHGTVHQDADEEQ